VNRLFSTKTNVLALLILSTGFGLTLQTASGQSVLDRIRKAAEDASKKGQQQKAPPQQTPKPTTQPPSQAPAPPAADSAPAPQRAGQPAAAAAASLPASTAKVDAQTMMQLSQLGVAGLFVSPSGAHFAAPKQRGSRWVVNYDGVDGPPFDEISDPVEFSPNGERYFYLGRQGSELAVMVDGKEIQRLTAAVSNFRALPLYTDRQGARSVFTKDSKRVVYAFADPQKNLRTLYIDGRPVSGGADVEIEHSNYLPAVVFSPDSEHYAFMTRSNPPQVFIDGKPAAYPVPRYYSPQLFFHFTGDSKHLFIIGTNERDSEVLLDGKTWIRSEAAIGIGNFTAAPAGVRAAVVAIFKNVSTLVVDGKPVGPCNPGPIQFSADGKHYAAACGTSNIPSRKFMIIDGKKHPEYDNLTFYGFTPNTGKVVYKGRINNGNKEFLVIGEEESDGFSSIPNVYLHGERIAWTGMQAPGRCITVVDGKASAPSNVCAQGFEFSPDGSRFAYLNGVNIGQLVIDGANAPGIEHRGTTTLGEAEPVRWFLFSPDSKHIVYYGSLPGRTPTRSMFIDGKALPLPQGVSFGPFIPRFTPDGRHVYYAVKANAELLLYVDGRVAAKFQNGNQSKSAAGHFPYEVSSGGGARGLFADIDSNGILTFIVQEGPDDIKRVRVTPPSDTNIDTMLADAQPAAGK
jgi:hypothetical protein